jgi:hypothetical protein
MTLTQAACAIVMACLATAGPDGHGDQSAVPDPAPVMQVRPCDDFELDGTGRARAWETTGWTPLNRRETGGLDYTARVKMLYSGTGLYVLLEATDRRLTATLSDFGNLWTEDVFEVFLWPDQRVPIYFEYEVSPLGAELPLLIPNLDGDVHGWRPWRDEPARRIRKVVSVIGGAQRSGADIDGWRAEIFLPYDLLRPLPNRVPRPGTRWRANIYRIDYDREPSTSWDWARVGPSFHEFQKFGTLVFR